MTSTYSHTPIQLVLSGIDNKFVHLRSGLARAALLHALWATGAALTQLGPLRHPFRRRPAHAARQGQRLTYMIILNVPKGLVEVLIHQHHYRGGEG